MLHTPPGRTQVRGRPGFRTAAAVLAVGMAGATLPTPLYGLYGEAFGFSELTATLIFATYAIGVVVTLLLAGNLSDRLGRRPVLLGALLLAAASAGCFLLADGLPLLYAGRLLSGCSIGLLSGTGTVTVLELAAPAGRSRAAFAATAANMGGLGCGTLLSGVLAQYVPGPLISPFLLHLVLLAGTAVTVLLLPETAVTTPAPTRPRPPGLYLASQVRSVFLPAALAAFSGFALQGLFTATAPAFLAGLGVRNLAVGGLTVFVVFLGSTVGQALAGDRVSRRVLAVGCLVLVAGLAMVGASLTAGSLILLVMGGACGGIGQGIAFRAGMAAVSGAAGAEHRAATVSSLFVVAYAGMSLPVVGVGALSTAVGLETAGLVFTGCVVLIAAVTGARLTRTRPCGPHGHGDPMR
ncbi:MFS transporter [Streptomyces sp. NPDC088147]|uniref:MFS transporter n=1 Tax=Streptomyces sp. NPDC088147 TaxID=3365830 RepID=UPI0037FC4E2E